MSHRQTASLHIVPQDDIPTFEECVEVPGHSDNLSINCSLDNDDGTDITHEIYGYLRLDSDVESTDAVILIDTYNNLETITTRGKYAHPIIHGAMQYKYIGVRQIIGGGSIHSVYLSLNLQ